MGREPDDGLARRVGADAAGRTVHIVPHRRRAHAHVASSRSLGRLGLVDRQHHDHRPDAQSSVAQVVGRQVDGESWQPVGLRISKS
jgi:hypothetical protein